MREIKFRAWDNSTKKMYYNSGLTVSNNSIIHMDGHIMQFIGLKDKNYKEIYEGDIIFSENHFGCVTGGDIFPSMRKVIYNDRDAKFELAFIATEEYAKAFNPSGQYLCKPNCEGSFEIIGNIYENPELCNH